MSSNVPQKPKKESVAVKTREAESVASASFSVTLFLAGKITLWCVCYMQHTDSTFPYIICSMKQIQMKLKYKA